MHRKNYSNKKAYKKEKRKLEKRTYGFSIYINEKLGLPKKR